MIFLGKTFKGQADTSATITAVITSIKQSVEDQFRNNIPVETWGNEWSYKDGNDVFTINVDSLADLEVRIKEKKPLPYIRLNKGYLDIRHDRNLHNVFHPIENELKKG